MTDHADYLRKMADDFDDADYRVPSAGAWMSDNAKRLRAKADEIDDLEKRIAGDEPSADYRIVSFGHDLLGIVELLTLTEGETYTDEQADGIIRQAAHWARRVADRHDPKAKP